MKWSWTVLLGTQLAACATLMSTSKQLPQSYAGLSTAELIMLVREHGRKTLRPVYRHLQREQQLAAAGQLIAASVADDLRQGKVVELVAALHLYQLTNDPAAARVFTQLIAPQQRHPILVQVGWQIATLMPSASMATAITQTLERALLQGREETLFLPQVAAAIAANKVTNTYTFLREGLHRTHHTAFARAMLKLNPTRASHDFLTYLSDIPLDALRAQIPAVENIPLRLMLLQHVRAYPVSTQHRQLATLFSYVISRDPALSEAAQQALAIYYDKHGEQLAQLLARLPYWVQFCLCGEALPPPQPVFTTFFGIVAAKDIWS